MAQGTKLETPDDHGVWISSGQDHGKPVRYKIRQIPFDVDRRLHREAYRKAKVRRIGKESTSAVKERFEDYTLLRAAYALMDTENFSIEIGDAGAAAIYSKLLGQEIAAGAEVVLDGKWTDELRRDVVRVVRNRAAWIVDQAEKLTEAEIEDEQEEAEGF